MNALQKYKTISPYLENEITLTELAKESGHSTRTLSRWIKQYREKGLEGLNRKTRTDKEQRRKLDESLIELTKALALQKPKLTVANIHRKVATFAKQKEQTVPSYTSIYNIIQQIDPALMTLAHEGSVAYRNKYELIYRRESSNANDMWQIDHCFLDILLINEKGIGQKPWLTIIQDDYSRAISGYFLSFEAPCAINTALALRQAIWKKGNSEWQVCGIPQILYTDNGADFISKHIEQVGANLKIRIVHSIPGRPQGKGRIERFFLTLIQQFIQNIPGYYPAVKDFTNPVVKSAKNKKPNAKLTISDLSKKIENFILYEYHLTVHSVTKEMPLQRWLGDGFLPQMPISLSELDLLLLTVSTTRKIHRDGIYFKSLRYMNTVLAAYIGEQVVIRYDPRDMAEIRVYFENQFLCNAICQNISDQVIHYEEIKKARQKRKRKLRKTIKETQQLLKDINNPKSDQPEIKKSKPTRSHIKRYYNE